MIRSWVVLVMTLLPLVLVMMLSMAVQAAPFGDKKDVAYAKSLWNALERAHLVGDGAIQTVPYAGQPPHGMVLQTLESTLTVHNNQAGPRGDTGVVIVKRNFGGEGITTEVVANNPDQHLMAVTVMFKRPGYDPDNQNWFWAKLKPDGEIHVNPKNMKLVGRVAKGMDQGCIACHKAAQGGDYVFNHDRYKN